MSDFIEILLHNFCNRSLWRLFVFLLHNAERT